jgi:hypothetical protein
MGHRVNSYETDLVDHPEMLRGRLSHARARPDREPPFSPDWDAAMDEIDHLTARLARIEREWPSKTPSRELAA